MHPVRKPLIGSGCLRTDTRARLELECGHFAFFDASQGDLTEQLVSAMEHGVECHQCEPQADTDALSEDRVAALRARIKAGEFDGAEAIEATVDGLYADVVRWTGGHAEIECTARPIAPELSTFGCVMVLIAYSVLAVVIGIALFLVAVGAAFCAGAIR